MFQADNAAKSSLVDCYKDIMAHLDGTGEDEIRLAHAEIIATLFGAHLTGVYTNRLPDISDYSSPVGAGACMEVERQLREEGELIHKRLKRHIDFYGEAPRQAAADGGYASRDNLAQAKALGVHDMAFHKKAGLRIKDMVKSNWVYRKLRNFRAGIESDISCLKRAFGLARCVWRGLDHFKAYVWSSVVAYNLALFARLKPT
jgi:hypothetical protein